MSTLNEVITPVEAAKLLNISTKQVQRLCSAGKFSARQDESGRWLILRASVIDKNFQSNKELFKELADLVHMIYENVDEEKYQKLNFHSHGDYHDLMLGGIPENLIKVHQAFKRMSDITIHSGEEVASAIESTKAKFLERFEENENLFDLNNQNEDAINYGYYLMQSLKNMKKIETKKRKQK